MDCSTTKNPDPIIDFYREHADAHGIPTVSYEHWLEFARPEEMEDVFRWLYDNLDLWSTDPHKQDQAIVIIRNGYVNIPLVADQEINLSATLIELSNI